MAGVYFFLAVAGFRMGIVGNFVVFVPYLLTILYLFISELYTGNKDPDTLRHAVAFEHFHFPLDQ
ncbi:Uncharacterised protein [Segatella copri]|nr:Uncharacterised protein [Segatella copri]